MTSILENEYKEPDRPYSQDELKFNRTQLFQKLRIGNVRAYHKQCGHFYFVKLNGRKEKIIIDSKGTDSGNCSVCWKLKKMGRLKHAASTVVKIFTEVWADEPTVLTYDDVDVEKVYYIWLYEH